MKEKVGLVGIFAIGVVSAQLWMPLVADAAPQSTLHTTEPKATAMQHTSASFTTVKEISLHPQHIVAKDPWSDKKTSWIPVNEMQNDLSELGIQTSWNGNTLAISSIPSGWTEATSKVSFSGTPPIGQMQFAMNRSQNGIERAPLLVVNNSNTHIKTTYLPIYYANLFLHEQLLIQATWTGNTWDLSPQIIYTPLTSIQSIVIDNNSPASMGFVPIHPTTVTQQLLAWLKSALETNVNLPKSTPNLIFNAYIGPSRLLITTKNHANIQIYPAYSITAVGHQGRYQVNYDTDVLAYVQGNNTIYLKSPQLYTWLKDNQWTSEFKS